MSKKGKNIEWAPELSEKEMEFTQPEMMLKLVGTIDERGWPHLTIITSNQAFDKNEIVWGQFSRGNSKKNVQNVNPKQGIFYMTIEMPFKCMRVKAKFTHTKKEGKALQHFNDSELLRYMTYMNVYKAYYNEVVAVSAIKKLSLLRLMSGIIKTLIAKGGVKTNREEEALNVIGYDLFTGVMNPKFLAYVDPRDGYPIIVPVIQLRAVDHNRLVFSPSLFKEELTLIPEGTRVAVIALNTDLASQVAKGTFRGYQRSRLMKVGIVDIEECYNSSPPLAGKYYPELEVREKVTDFHL
ncbi:MAG: hypothetical protein R6U96_04150 [Promethearchaeia archaeon]